MKKGEKYPRKRMRKISDVYAGPPVSERAAREVSTPEVHDEITEPEVEIEDVYGGPEMMKGFRRGEPEEPCVEEPCAEETEEDEADESAVKPPFPARKTINKPRFPNKEFDPRIAMGVYGGPDYFSPNSAPAPGFGIPVKRVSDEAVSKNAAIDPNAKFCKECGSILSPNAKFCGECGTPVPKDDGETV